MAITRASEDVGTRTVYCSAEDVRTYLAGVAADDAGDVFQSVWNSATVEKLIEKYLVIAKEDVDAICQRDFNYHHDVEVVVDGRGGQWLILSSLGFTPLLEVSSIAIDDDEQELDDYVVYEDGRIGAVTYVSDEDTVTSSSWLTFPEGRQNVGLTLSWGYQDVPAKVEMASAFIVGKYMTSMMDAAVDLNTPGILPGMNSIRYGDMTIGVGGIGVYERLSKRLDTLARKALVEFTTPLVVAPSPKMAQVPTFPFARVD